MSIELLIIDCQNDFCSPDGSLYVPNAEKDCQNLSAFIKQNIDHINSIHMTLDTHPFYHIAHPIFWKDKDGNQPPYFTQITYSDFKNGVYTPADETQTEKVEKYLLNLESKGKYNLTIWPPHCLLATWGSCIVPEIWEAVHLWETKKPGRCVSYVTKAMNPFTEHYSAIQAEVPDPSDPSTRTNFTFIDKLKQKNIFIAGEALSHCVANTVRDLCIYIPASRITILSDCTSNVSGFEQAGKDFIENYKEKGMRFIPSTEVTL